MTDLAETIALLRELDAKATPGPWAEPHDFKDQFGEARLLCGNNGRGKYACHVYTNIKAAGAQTTARWEANRLANFDLIRVVRNNLTDLLDAAEAGMRARDAVAWASGEDPEGYPEFQPRGEGDPPYWWRKTMRQIAEGKIVRSLRRPTND